MVESPSEAIIKELKTSMFKFLWNCKPDKIKRDLIIQDYNDGGLKIIDNSSLNKALKASWVRRILKRDSKLSQIYKTELKQYGEFTNTIRWKNIILQYILLSCVVVVVVIRM